jgi:hypothetical protein
VDENDELEVKMVAAVKNGGQGDVELIGEVSGMQRKKRVLFFSSRGSRLSAKYRIDI